MTFLVIDQVFRIFPLFSLIFRIFTLLDIVHNPFLTRKSPSFTLFILSRTSDNTTSQNIGGRMNGPSPTLNFVGAVPQFPLGFRPWCFHHSFLEASSYFSILPLVIH